jgi:hypothetical protein
MVVFVSIGTLAGVLLGLRFNVFVLVPAILLATGVIIASGHELRMIALTVFGTAVSLQFGYLVGCIVRVMAAAYLQARGTLHHRIQIETGVK